MFIRSLNLLCRSNYYCVNSSHWLRKLRSKNAELFKSAYSSTSDCGQHNEDFSCITLPNCLKQNFYFRKKVICLSQKKFCSLYDPLDTVKNVWISTRHFSEVQNADPNSVVERDFLKNEDDVVMVYIDGACLNNGKDDARAGLGVWFNYGHPLNVSAPITGRATNNNAEIQAARVAVVQARRAGVPRLCINTDSKFLISCITDWIHKWKENGWKLSNRRPVKNKQELLELDRELASMECVAWRYVAAHRDNEGNRMADKLAREGAAMFIPASES